MPSSKIKLACIILLVIALISGCSKLRSDSGGGHTGSSADSPKTVPSAPAPPSSNATGAPTTWEANATSLSGGKPFTLTCSPGGTAHSVWGSDIYTTDSSICTAAVHSGLITFQQGGTVTVELRPGRPVYGASERNGVTTSAYGPWQSSFVFKAPNTDAVWREADEQTAVLWNTSATMVGGENATWKFKCPPNGKASSVWGTDIYTLDSSICTAAVHAGKITLESGGSVTIEVRQGESSYKGSTRNGIKTNDYGAYGRSFVVK